MSGQRLRIASGWTCPSWTRTPGYRTSVGSKKARRARSKILIVGETGAIISGFATLKESEGTGNTGVS